MMMLSSGSEFQTPRPEIEMEQRLTKLIERDFGISKRTAMQLTPVVEFVQPQHERHWPHFGRSSGVSGRSVA